MNSLEKERENKRFTTDVKYMRRERMGGENKERTSIVSEQNQEENTQVGRLFRDRTEFQILFLHWKRKIFLPRILLSCEKNTRIRNEIRNEEEEENAMVGIESG